jgi:hypothetical protein
MCVFTVINTKYLNLTKAILKNRYQGSDGNPGSQEDSLLVQDQNSHYRLRKTHTTVNIISGYQGHIN